VHSTDLSQWLPVSYGLGSHCTWDKGALIWINLNIDEIEEGAETKVKKKGGQGLNGLKYIIHVLKGFLKEFVMEMEREREHSMLIIEDGAPGHTSKLASQAWSELGIKKLLHLLKPLDPNLTEILWYILKTHTVDICGSLDSLENLWEVVKKVWDEFTLEEIKKYTATMDGCVWAIKDAEGWHTKY
jgi:hypothetical protein